MSGISPIVKDIGLTAVSPFAEAINRRKEISGFFSDLFHPQESPQLNAPKTKAPNPQDASTTAIQTQLAHEQNARSTVTAINGPGGLTTDPTTTSSLLMGT